MIALNRRRYMGFSGPPVPETRIVAIINVTSATSQTVIMSNGAQSNFSAIEIDGVTKSSVEYRYVFGSTGEHTVKYTLVDNTTIAGSAFKNVSTMKSVIIPDSVTTVGASAFEGNALESFVIGKGVASFGQYAIRNNKSLTSIVVDSENTTFDSRDNCNAIIHTAQNKLMLGCNTSTVPEGVVEINERAFIQSGITSIIIPSTVTKIGGYCFYQAPYFSSMTVLATTPPAFDTNSGLSGVSSSLVIYVPADRVDAYKSSWSRVADKIQAIPT